MCCEQSYLCTFTPCVMPSTFRLLFFLLEWGMIHTLEVFAGPLGNRPGTRDGPGPNNFQSGAGLVILSQVCVSKSQSDLITWCSIITTFWGKNVNYQFYKGLCLWEKPLFKWVISTHWSGYEENQTPITFLLNANVPLSLSSVCFQCRAILTV